MTQDNNTPCDKCGARTDGFLCRDCGKEIEQAIAEMPSLMHEVSIVATRQARVYRANGYTDQPADAQEWVDEERRIPAFLRSPHARMALSSTAMPVNLPACELLWEAGNTLSTWTRHLAEQRGAALPSAPGMVPWLTAHAEAFRFDEAGAQALDEITYLRRQMERAVDRSPSRIYAGPCHAPLADGHRCQRALYAWPGADEIVCDGYRSSTEYDVGCRAMHTPADRRLWLLAELEGALLPLETLRRALPALYPDMMLPAMSTWRSWQFRGRLAARTVDRNGVELYRGEDVIALVMDEAKRSGPRRNTRAS